MSIIETAVGDANTYYINQHEAEEARLEKRAIEIERIIAESMQPGGEFYPFNVDNISEAMRHMPNVSMTVLSMSLATAAELQDNSYADSLFLVAIKKLVKEYWVNCATVKAKENYID